jgi:Sterol-sensing domain of SREBP cleavage-activation
VEKTPPQSQSGARVATAVGAVGHLSLVSAAQNIATLLLLSRVISPKLVAFCGFAAISLTVDLIFFFTFFVAMLSVDLRRYELEDSFEEAREQYELERIRVPMYKAAKPQQIDVKRRRMRNALLYPRVWSTIFMVSFLLMLNWHFLNGNTALHKDQKCTVILDHTQSKEASYHRHGSIHKETRDSADWLKSQEHQTTKEILHATNPQAHSVLARVYNPLVVVLKPTDRDSSLGKDLLMSSPIITPTFGPLWLPVVLFCGAVALMIAIWNYSLCDGPSKRGSRSPESRPFSSAQCLPRGHSLDIFMLSASSRRILSSVGFDHEIRVWNLDSQVITSRVIHTPKQRNLWPVAALAVDGKAKWLAIYSKLGEVSFWHIQHQCFDRSILTDLGPHIITCFFTSGASSDSPHSATRLLAVSATGRLVDIEVETGNVTSHQICANRVRSAHTNSHRRMPLRVITISEDNRIYVSARRENCWTTQALDFSAPIFSEPSCLRYTIVPDLSMVALVSNVDTCQLHLIDLLSG